MYLPRCCCLIFDVSLFRQSFCILIKCWHPLDHSMFNGFGRTLFVHLRREHELWTASDFCKKWCVTNSRYEKTSDTWDRHNLLMFWLGEDVLSVIPSPTEKLGNEMLGSLIAGEAAWARHVSRDREMWRVVCSGVSAPFPNTGIIGIWFTQFCKFTICHVANIWWYLWSVVHYFDILTYILRIYYCPLTVSS